MSRVLNRLNSIKRFNKVSEINDQVKIHNRHEITRNLEMIIFHRDSRKGIHKVMDKVFIKLGGR